MISVPIAMRESLMLSSLHDARRLMMRMGIASRDSFIRRLVPQREPRCNHFHTPAIPRYSVGMYSAIFTDIDGTLLDSGLRVGERTRKALRKAYAKGVRIVLSSGRYIKGMEMASNQLGIPVIFSAINGAIIKDGDEHLRRILIDRHPYEAAARYLKGRVKSLIAFSEMRFAIDADDSWYEMQNRICGDVGVRMDISSYDEVCQALSEEPCKILVKDSDAGKIARIVEELRRIVGNEARILSSSLTNIEVLPPGIDKTDSLDIVSRHLGIGIDETIAFGDWDNDAGMLRAAGLGIAMAGGSETAKSAADYVTLSNDEDGIAYALERFGVI